MLIRPDRRHHLRLQSSWLSEQVVVERLVVGTDTQPTVPGGNNHVCHRPKYQMARPPTPRLCRRSLCWLQGRFKRIGSRHTGVDKGEAVGDRRGNALKETAR